MSDNLNMEFESIYINCEQQLVVSEGGFEDFPFHVPRWMKSSNEKHGRGVGTEILPQTRMVNIMKRDFNEVGNKWTKPPMEILDTFEGDVDLTPGAENFVTEMNSIKAISGDLRGSFPITKEMLESERAIIKEAFFNNVFTPLQDLTGDRRTTVEIRARDREALRKLTLPVARMQAELFNPLIARVTGLLVKHGVIRDMPEEVANQKFDIEYIGPLALELKSEQNRAFQAWAAGIAEMEAVWPGVKDVVNSDGAARRQAKTMGVNVNDINSEEEVIAIRQQRAEELARQQALEAAQVGAQAYSQTSGAADAGSPAAQLQEAIGG